MLLTAVGCAGWAFAAQGGRWSDRLDVLTHFMPLLMAVAAVTVLYAVFAEPLLAKLALIGFGGVGMVLAGWLMVPEYLARRVAEPAAAPAGQIRLIQLNAWRSNQDLDGTVDWLLAQDADVIVLQEADAIGPVLKRRSTYHATCERCSVMIFSKAAPAVLDIPTPEDKRVRPPIVGVTLRDSRGDFTVLGTHYAWPVPAGLQQSQGRGLARLIASLPRERLILAGDFNSTPWSFTRRREDALFGLERLTRGMSTWPARGLPGRSSRTPFPLLPIDHVYAGSGWRTAKVERGPRLGSDHYPVIVTLAPSP
jgi:endonuclease/exonuclease/phosphatase (EEP) superfamily protein YafD